MLVRDILRKKGTEVVTILPDKTVDDAVDALNEHRIGALVVVGEGGSPAGIITERDILRLWGARTRDRDTERETVGKVMTGDLIICLQDDSLDYVMGVMTKNRIRHLPVLAERRLAGIISIGDVVNALLKEAAFENRMMRDYIHGIY